MIYNLNEEFKRIIKEYIEEDKEINDKKYFQVIECLTILKDHNGIVEIQHTLPATKKYNSLRALLKSLHIMNGVCINVVKIRNNEYKLVIEVNDYPMLGIGVNYKHHRIIILSNMDDLHEDYVTDNIPENS